MTFLQALAYFLKEACSNLGRSWKISLLAILTITVTVFLGGIFLIASNNLRHLADQWRDESRLVVYMRAGVDNEAINRVKAQVEQLVSAEELQIVDPETAGDRFRTAFPSLGDLLDGSEKYPLPASIEISGDLGLYPEAEVKKWLAQLKEDPSVEMIDDDRDWLGRLDSVILVVEGLASMIGLILLITAIFTISSVIRLTAYLYQDEIAVMRLVGATEFFIRGPFYMEGLLQGLAGGLLALGLLFGGHSFLFSDADYQFLPASVLAESFLPLPQLLFLVLLGGLAGLIGAVLSLRKESLGQTAETEYE